MAYNPAIPIETFDLIVTDECHRSIYGLWRQVLEYFDAHLIGLTATPSAHTLGFFFSNLVAEYPYEQSVVDGVNVGFEVFRIKTQVGEEGGIVDAQLPRPGARPPHPRHPLQAARCRPAVHQAGAGQLGHRAEPDPRRAPVLQGQALHRAVPRPHRPVGAQDPDLRQGRQPRRGDRHAWRGRSSARATTSPRRSPTRPARSPRS